MPSDKPEFIEVPRPRGGSLWRLAVREQKGHGAGKSSPGVFWLGGFKSDMQGAKASAVDSWARDKGNAFLRFDYSGHGESDGRFEEGCIGDWLEQSLCVFEAKTQGPQILVGTSMGAWIALLLARRLAQAGRADRLAALVLLAPAVDFTEELMWKTMPEDVRREIMEKGVWTRPSLYAAEGTPITRKLVEEARDHLLLSGVVRAHAPVFILQGLEDPDVPWTHARALVERLVADPVAVSFIPGGDHRLSRDEDIALLIQTIEMATTAAK